MFCSYCGKQIPDNANFCPECGKPQKQDLQQQYETCEIMWEKTKGHFSLFGSGNYGRFYARAIGPKGTYVAGYSTEFKIGDESFVPSKPKFGDPFNVLVNQLTQEGWNSEGSYSKGWYMVKFRRYVR
jgi:hypothetical protein